MAAGMKRQGATMAAAGRSMTKGLTVPMLAIGAGAVILSRQYGGAMRLISTQAGASRKEMERMKKAVLELASSGKVKQQPKELAEALFRIESVGYRGAKALSVLKSSADLATLGQSDMESTTYALVSALETGIQGTETLGGTIGTLNAIVGAGNLRMEDLTQSLSSGVLISAHQVGLSLTDVGAAMDTMTARGMPANVAATRLRMTFTLMAAPTEKAKKALKGIGLDEEALAKQMQGPKGLIGALQLLKESLSGLTKIEQTQLLSEAFGGARSGTTMMALIQNLTDVESRFKQIAETSDQVKTKLKEATSTPGFKLDASVAKLEAAFIKLGDQILPVIVPVIQDLAAGIGAVGTAFAMLPEPTQRWIVLIGILLTLAGPLLTIYGKMLVLGGRLITWLYGLTTATQTAAVANVELAASIEAVNVAQAKQSMTMASGRKVSWASTAAVGAAPAVVPATAATSSARTFAGRFAGGLASFLPAALLMVGLGNIISSVVSGDTKGAAFKSGGAIAGAVAGGIAFGLPGALVGAGLGSIVGGELNKIIGGEKLDEPTGMKEYTNNLVKLSKEGARSQTQAASLMEGAGKKISSAHHRQQRAVKGVREAEQNLKRVRSSDAATIQRIVAAEIRLKEARHKVKAATRSQTQAEQLSKREKVALRNITTHNAVIALMAIGNLHKEERALNDLLGKQQKHKVGIEAEQNTLKKLGDVRGKLAGVQKKLNVAYAESGRVSPKFQTNLEKTTRMQRRVIEEGFMNPLKVLSAKQRHFTRIAHANWEKYSSTGKRSFRELAEKAERDMTRVGRSVNEVKGKMGPFQTETHRRMTMAADDVRNFKKASILGVGKVETKLGGFADRLGITNVQFGSKEAGDGGKKQRGGPITVPGMGTGDTVPLMAHVEPGEVIHVLNTRAVKDRKKLASLERINNETPRFQGGGTLGTMHNYKGLSGDTDFLPATGFALSKMATGTGTHISVTDGYRSVAEQAALYALYISGQGNLAAKPSAGAPHPSGVAADIAPGRETFGSVANKYGLGFTVPSESWHIELLNAAQGAFGMFAGQVPKMPKMTFTGPAGMLQELGQGTLNTATKMAQQYLNQNVGAGGFGSVATGPVQEMAKQMVGNIWGGGQWGPFNLLEMAEAGWDYTAVNPSSGAAGLAQALPPSKYPPGAWPPSRGLESAKIQLEWMMGYIKERYGDPAGAWAFHQANNWYQKGGTLAKGIRNVVTGIRKGKHLPKYKAMLKRVKRKIDGIGLGGKRLGKLAGLSKDAEKYSEYASNASSLTTSASVENPLTGEEEDVVTQGLFKGQNEAAWLNQQLGSLLRLRGQTIGAHGAIEGKQLPRVDSLIKDAKARLRAVQKAIREAEEAKRKIEKKIDEIEQAQKKSKQAVDKEVRELENSLRKAQAAKHPNKEQLEAIRGQIKTKKETSSSSDKSIAESLKKLNEEVDAITRQNKARVRGEGALKDTIIPSLTTKQTGLHETMKSLYSDGGEVSNFSFLGLKNIQGAGGPTGSIPEPPTLGELGGEIFQAQNRLRELGEVAKVKSKKEDTGPSEREELEKVDAEDWKRQYMVSQAQYAVLGSVPSVQQLAAVPFAGSFAKGGVMVAEVGEKGREIVAAPQGSRVLPSGEVNAALRDGGSTSLVIEELNVYEDGTVDIKTGGETFNADVRKVNRKQSRGAAKPSPGIKRRGK